MPMISLQISDDLQKQLDGLQSELGYTSRSECLREIILEFIRNHHEELPNDGPQIANITVHYEAREDIATKFAEESQKYDRLIKSATQHNLKNRIIKTLIVKGAQEEINDFYKAISSDRLFKSTITYLVMPEHDVSNGHSTPLKKE